MNKNRSGFCLILAALFVVASSCGGGGTSSAPPTPVIQITDSTAPIDDHQVTFDSVQPGNLSDQTVTVENAGTADLSVGSIGNANSLAAPFSITADTCSRQTIAPSGTCSMTITFEPSTTGSFNDSFDIPISDPDTPALTIIVIGTGAPLPAPNISVTDSVNPESDLQILFGSVMQDSSADQTVTIANTGGMNLIIGNVATADSLAAPFSIAADTCTGQSIAPAGSCTVTVRFRPAAAYSFEDTFDIPSNDPHTSAVTIRVSGIGTALPVPNIVVKDTIIPQNDLHISFGNVAEGNMSDQILVVNNTGTANLVIGNVASANPLAAPFSIISDTCSGQSIAPSGYCNVKVRFAPSSRNSFNDSFDIPNNDPDTPSIDVSVQGLNSPQMGGAIQGNALALSKTVTTLAGRSLIGSGDGTGLDVKFNYPIAVTSDGTNLYVADCINNTIRKIVLSTGAVTTLAGKAGEYGYADGTGTNAKFYRPAGITTDGTNLYVADSHNLAIRKIVISTGAVTTLAGTAGSYGSADGTGAAARFRLPRGITTDGTHLYVVDSDNNTIRQINISTRVVTTIAGTPGVSGSDDGTGTQARFRYPYGITKDGTNLYVTDLGNTAIRQINILTGVVSTIVGSGSGIGGYGITTDGTNLYVTSPTIVWKVVIASGAVTTFAGKANYGGSADGTGTSAQFNGPCGITIDGTNLYVADSDNHVIRKIEISTSTVTTVAGTVDSAGSANGIGAAARFNAPVGITTDGANLYVAEKNNNAIRQIVISTGAVTTIAGAAGSSGSVDGTGTAARFSSPEGITTDGTNLYVADTYNHSIRQIVISTGVVTTLAGGTKWDDYGYQDGTGRNARFRHPRGITTDGVNLYVADSGNDIIRQINISTCMVTTLAGLHGTSGSDDGIGTAARFNNPTGITTDGANLYVTDMFGNLIRKIVISTGVVITLVGKNAGLNYPDGITSDGTNLYVVDQYTHMIRTAGSSWALTLVGGGKGSADGIGGAARFYYPRGITTDGVSLYVADTANNTIRRIQ